ncbi:hypothetical protein HAX54_016454 [Datura stramonium]|uniref:Symplekin C-terminal domain-containing protein n=1 Tax=Datura stramonium TaxID=4076 RepID=A0ABS8UKT9_DATST|nr:hypothetical protein [Datura stramonium]
MTPITYWMQVWRMPKLWVGFLKCVSQTQPHSFPVLLQLPPPQLESALNKYANLRSPLVAFANQPNVKASLPRSAWYNLVFLMNKFAATTSLIYCVRLRGWVLLFMEQHDSALLR